MRGICREGLLRPSAAARTERWLGWRTASEGGPYETPSKGRILALQNVGDPTFQVLLEQVSCVTGDSE